MNLELRCDFQLVASQLRGVYEAKNGRMEQYLKLAQSLVAGFAKFMVAQVPISENCIANALANLVSKRVLPFPCGIEKWYALYPCHTPILSPNRMVNLNWVRDVRLYTGTLYLFFFSFFFQTLVGPSLIIESKYHIQKIQNKTTTGVVSIKIYTYILSPIYIYKNCTFTFTNQSAEPTCSEPLQVCWPGSI